MISLFLREEIKSALKELSLEEVLFSVERGERFGDYTTNVSMVVASGFGKNPRDVAKEIVGGLSKSKKFEKNFLKPKIAGPGFINFYLTDGAVCEELEALGKKIEKGFDFLHGKKINVEFISANPTGELHIGHGRGAFYGDALSNVFSFSGAKVTREYYVNDSKNSNQVVELGKTALGTGEQYKTLKLLEMVKKMDFSGMEPKDAGTLLAKKIQEYNSNFTEGKLGIKFDKWFSEESLYESGKVEKTVKVLRDKKLLHKKKGEGEALWLLTSEHGDDEDRVVARSDGTYTYFLSDIAYHSEKFGRGYDKVIDMWGADHHGHVKRIEAAKEILGWKGELKVFITQLVSLKENGVSSKMSKRAGNVVLLEDLVDEFGIDVVRWFFSDKSLSTHMEFDMALAKEHSAKNPVFYVQYAHARICSILEKAKSYSPDGSGISDAIKENSGRALSAKIIQFPEIISGIAEDCQVHKLTTYAYELASAFAQFYEKVRIVGDDEYKEGALLLAEIAKNTLAKSLGLLGISAPGRM